ncbi:MAG: glycoside hydrolase, partial [Bacteroidota bacterium]
DDDIVVGTHGRSFWILDDITPLRQLTPELIKSSTIFYSPQMSYRVRWNMNTDTPIPQEEPAGQNPPDGAIINYYLNDHSDDVTLDIRDSKFKLIRHYSSLLDTFYKIPADNTPAYWIRPQEIISSQPGSHRFTWDMHYQPLNITPSYPIAAIYMNTAPNETSPWVMPGSYTLYLTIHHSGDMKIYKQQLEIKMDPRVKTSMAGLQKQHDLSVQCYEARKECIKTLEEIKNYRAMLRGQMTNPPVTVADELNKKDKIAAGFENTPQNSQEPSFGKLNSSFASIFNVLQESDTTPTSQTISALAIAQKQLQELKAKWAVLKDNK